MALPCAFAPTPSTVTVLGVFVCLRRCCGAYSRVVGGIVADNALECVF